MAAPIARWLGRAFDVQEDEAGAVIAGFALFFLLFAGYFMLRPVRETMGIAGGVRNLQWLFTGTFVATLAAMPLFGWIAGRVRRRRILYWVYGFFTANLLLFALAFALWPGDPWIARTFYIWLSVFNLIAISVGWSVLVDVFTAAQARRLFALMAAGASLGGLIGPLAGVFLVGVLGHSGLVLVAALLLLASTVAARSLHRWRDARPLHDASDLQRQRPLGGSPLAGATEVFRSPYLLGIAVFVVLLASVTTFLYFEQARLVEARFPDPTDQTRVFGIIDTVVQALAILSQLFITGRVARTVGVGALLVAVPLVVAAGFLWLAFAPTFAVLAVVMVVRRAGEYAFVRPGREMLYTVVPAEAKYKAKNFNDTVVYRGADAVSGWVKAGIDMVAQQPAVAMVLGTVIALAWSANGAWLARAQRRLAS
ncbi:MFS transporter [Luteimonas sp. MC1825]|uniref:NTP/NDP exchange transporter n=1 Tax=Luteimonas sp. MC1825 TaxID=2761107 RepID=UPI001611701E|nr:MFS transporter [Luteimonas sp. MC1825]MBB6598731.1 MFS transporter [Luteimonas sp. MC1825]QOC88896.1 MFS transporter [Luteimonas sp. MC1825]